MASYSVASAKTATLVAATQDTVTLTKDYNQVEVTNLDGAAALTVRVDSGVTNATVDGDDCVVLPAAIGSVVIASPAQGNSQVKLISSGTPKYQVRGL